MYRFSVGVEGRFCKTSVDNECRFQDIRRQLTQNLSIRRICTNGMNDGEREFPFGQILRKPLVIRVLFQINNCISGEVDLQ